jgi:hypothetical protein
MGLKTKNEYEQQKKKISNTDLIKYNRDVSLRSDKSGLYSSRLFDDHFCLTLYFK